MDREGLEELFAPFGPVGVRRVFSGHGVYADALCFALALRGEIYIKADAETEAEFAAAGSEPFSYSARGREVVGFWRLLASAYDDEDELKRWSQLGLAAARRAAAVKAAKAAKRAGLTKATTRPGRARPATGSAAKRRPRG